LALMQPVLNRSGGWISVIYLLDVSQSISPQAISEAIDWIEETDAAGAPDHSRFVPFAANSLVFEELDELRTVQVTSIPTEEAIDQSATDLEGALTQASRSFAPYHLKRLVLISDGNENAGAVKDSILRMNQENVKIFTRSIAARSDFDAWVEGVMAPATVTEEELFPLEVLIQSQVATTGEVEVRFGTDDHETREVELELGINRVAFEIRLTETGPTMIEAEVKVGEDRFPNNNVFRQSVVVEGPPRILYIEGRSESADYLHGVLEGEGIEVRLSTPGEAPLLLEELDTYAAIILSDVEASTMTPVEMEALAVYVQELGGGFVLVGGESVYGEDGYSGTAIEEILPVKFNLEKPSVALIIVLDKSGSMGGEKLELAKEASKAAVDVLQDDHRIGIVAFDYDHYWPVDLQEADNREDINRRISRIIAGGETNIYPALEEAYTALIDVDAEVKHVILLSDGRSLPEDFEELALRMSEESMTVTTVAVGNGADRELLANISIWGGGRTYFMEDANRVPQVFTDEAELATQGTLVEKSFQPVVLKQVEAFKGIDFSTSPPLLGYVSTLGKETAEILLESDIEKPILARWQYGLGKTVAFTSDVKDRWAAEWLDWDGYSKLWPQLVRETMRRRDDGQLDLQINKVGDQARISITAFEEDGSFREQLTSQLSVIDPQQNVSIVNLRHSGPGTYEGEFPLGQRGPYLFRMVGDEAGASRILPYSYPEEYHFYPPDTDLLRELSAVTDGTFDAEVSDIFRPSTESTVRPTPLWPYLAVVALLLYLGDIVLRRIRLFETISPSNPTAARSSASP
jgi:Ca-activated chloride channel family protein